METQRDLRSVTLTPRQQELVDTITDLVQSERFPKRSTPDGYEGSLTVNDLTVSAELLNDRGRARYSLQLKVTHGDREQFEAIVTRGYGSDVPSDATISTFKPGDWEAQLAAFVKPNAVSPVDLINIEAPRTYRRLDSLMSPAKPFSVQFDFRPGEEVEEAVERLALEATKPANVVALSRATHIELGRSELSVDLDRVAAGLLSRRLGKQVYIVDSFAEATNAQ